MKRFLAFLIFTLFQSLLGSVANALPPPPGPRVPENIPLHQKSAYQSFASKVRYAVPNSLHEALEIHALGFEESGASVVTLTYNFFWRWESVAYRFSEICRTESNCNWQVVTAKFPTEKLDELSSQMFLSNIEEKPLSEQSITRLLAKEVGLKKISEKDCKGLASGIRKFERQKKFKIKISERRKTSSAESAGLPGYYIVVEIKNGSEQVTLSGKEKGGYAYQASEILLLPTEKCEWINLSPATLGQ